MFKWEIFLPLLLVKLSLSIHAKSEPSIKFTSPAPAARVWVDEEHPVEVAFQARGIRLPDEGYMLLYINGREIPQRFERAQNAVSLPDLDEGSYTIEVKLFNRQGEFAEVSASSAFLARRYLELMVHEEYPVSAEGPRSDGSLGHLPGLQEWDHSTAADPPGSPAARLRELWERRLGGGEDGAAADAAADGVFRAYREFHGRIMADPALWASNSFLVYRTMDRGLGLRTRGDAARDRMRAQI